MVKAFIITQEEPFFIPKMIKFILEHQENSYSICGLTILKPHRKNKNYFHWFRERAIIYTWLELIISGYAFLICKLTNLLSKHSSYSVKSIARSHSIPIVFSQDINSRDFLKVIKEQEIDVIISISCPQLFQNELLSSVRYCINAHGTLLPRHRGVFGSWWSLYSGDKIFGSTIHTMESKLDAGEILWQKEVINMNETQYSIAYKTKKQMAEGICEVLEKVNNNSISFIKPNYKTSYHRAPTKHEGKLFHKYGYRVIRIRDLHLLLKRKY